MGNKGGRVVSGRGGASPHTTAGQQPAVQCKTRLWQQPAVQCKTRLWQQPAVQDMHDKARQRCRTCNELGHIQHRAQQRRVVLHATDHVAVQRCTHASQSARPVGAVRHQLGDLGGGQAGREGGQG